MSVEAVVARVEQLQQLFSAATAPGGNGGQDFASQLTSATSVAQPATVAAPAAVQAAATMSLAGPVAGTSALPPGVPYGAEITAAARRPGSRRSGRSSTPAARGPRAARDRARAAGRRR